jgi:hypothetical protein
LAESSDRLIATNPNPSPKSHPNLRPRFQDKSIKNQKLMKKKEEVTYPAYLYIVFLPEGRVFFHIKASGVSTFFDGYGVQDLHRNCVQEFETSWI